ncbi:MAG: ureidoacrylate peracid hydrolase [Gaiellaceae bacterium]|nr:ureidoacrylate peracid hydrolase [Gaiellaceae bacterium]
MKFDRSATALLVVDLQNDTVGEGGAFADSGAADFFSRHGVHAKARSVLDAARSAGVAVIFVWHVDEPGHRDSTRNAELFRSIADADGLVRGTWGVKPIDGIEPQDGEAVVEKQRMSSFNDTTLDTKLRGLGAQTIVVIGAWTNWAVEHTCRDGADLGYEVVVVTDATATISDEFQNAALNFALTTVAERATAADVVAALAG